MGQVSERNLRRALLSFETCRVAQYPLTDAQPVQLPDWELYIQVPIQASCPRSNSHAYMLLYEHCTPLLQDMARPTGVCFVHTLAPKFCAELLCVRWCACMQEIATAILQEQTPKRLYEVRGKLYELLVNCLPPELILRKLTLELFRCAGDA